MSKSYDLSTSSKWANLADGEHTVKIKAKGSGYGTSSFSNSVTVTKGATGYTVTIPGNTHGDSGYGFYSIDDGATWVDMFNSTATTVKTKTIKFKAVGDEWWNCAIYSKTLGVSIAPYHDTAISDNYTLTQNITDLSVSYYSQ